MEHLRVLRTVLICVFVGIVFSSCAKKPENTEPAPVKNDPVAEPTPKVIVKPSVTQAPEVPVLPKTVSTPRVAPVLPIEKKKITLQLPAALNRSPLKPKVPTHQTREEVFEESYAYALSIAETAAYNLEVRMINNARAERNNQNALKLFKAVSENMREEKDKIIYSKKEGFDVTYCVNNPFVMGVTLQNIYITWDIRLGRHARSVIICASELDSSISAVDRAMVFIHEFVHYSGVRDECATEVQTQLILHLANLEPVRRTAYISQCKLESYLEELKSRLN